MTATKDLQLNESSLPRSISSKPCGPSPNTSPTGTAAGAHMETSIVVELVDLGERTKMTMTHIGIPADSPGGQGWAMAIDKLEQRVAEHSG
jgi:hypothetical protein